jgi:tRNA(Ile2) C34 agmatinyltransferase TiaS
MLVFIGMDDTDNAESRGTGHLAREAAARLSAHYSVLGVVRHQLFFDPRVPYTKNNSSAALLVQVDDEVDPAAVFQQVKAMMRADFQPGSDPGLCVATAVPEAVIHFGRRVKVDLVTQAEARQLAAQHGILLEGLGGTQGGVIGALAAVGLAASGEDGRYIQVGSLRELSGLQPVSALLSAGIQHVQTLEGQPVVEGMINTQRLRPARRGGVAVTVVQWENDAWQPLKLD